MQNKQILSWALYDLANSVFTVTVISGFFPLFLKLYWANNLSPTESTYYLGLANTISGLILFVISPYLGTFSDKQGNKKLLLSLFAFIGMLYSAFLAFIPAGAWQWAVLCYIIATIGYQGANIFYDSLLLNIANKKQLDYASSLGYSLGYIGGGVFFLFAVLLYLQPHWFGLKNGVEGIKVSFFAISIWWLLFSLPLLFFVKEEKKEKKLLTSFAESYLQIKSTLKNIKKYKNIFLFLIAYWFYIDGATTMIKMAVDYGIALGFPASSLIVALLLVQFIAFPFALLYYKFGEKIGMKKAILICIIAYSIITASAYFITKPIHFYFLAAAVGVFQGGLFALSRSYYAKLIPKKQAGEFFGFYTLWTRFASLLGPFLIGFVALKTGNSRIAIVIVVTLFLIGGILFFFLKESPAREQN